MTLPASTSHFSITLQYSSIDDWRYWRRALSNHANHTCLCTQLPNALVIDLFLCIRESEKINRDIGNSPHGQPLRRQKRMPYSAIITLRSQRLVNGRVKLGCLLAFTAGKGEGLEASSFPARLTHTTTRSFLPSNALMHHCKPHLNTRELLVDKGSLCLLQGQVSARHW